MTWTALCIVLAVLLVLPLAAQPAEQAQDLDRAAAEQKLQERVAFFEEMGLPRDAATAMAIFAESGMDPAQMVLMMMMGEQGGEQAMLPMLLMNSMRGRGGQAPAMVERDGRLFIAEGGRLYVIDEETLQVVSSVEYAPQPAIEDSPIWSLLGPMMAGARGKAQRSACISNLKQLGLAIMVYLQDHDNWLPDENWVEAVYPYIQNRSVFTCPSRPEQPVGYALNEALLPMDMGDLPQAAETVLAFETLEIGEAPVGGPGLVPPEGIHEGGINVLFADGHVKWMLPEATVDLLAGR
ncbi:MAG: H-X9-DG-CTERM domain-containing protein [Armatimonadota bacterium]